MQHVTLLLLLLLPSCALKQDTLPDCAISYAVSSLDNTAYTFSVSYIDNSGNTVNQGNFTTRSWASPTYEEGFTSGDYVEIKVSASGARANLLVSLYKNYQILEKKELRGSNTEVTISGYIP